LPEDRETFAKCISIEQGRNSGRVKEATLAAGFDGDDGGAGLGAIAREDAGDVDAGSFESSRYRAPQLVVSHYPRGGDFHAELRHRQADVADVSAGRKAERIQYRQPARRRRMARVHRRSDQISDDESEDGSVHDEDDKVTRWQGDKVKSA